LDAEGAQGAPDGLFGDLVVSADGKLLPGVAVHVVVGAVSDEDERHIGLLRCALDALK
jgi:hypothetical protein